MDSTDLPGRGIKPLVSLLAHPLRALAAALLVIAVGVPMAWKKGMPIRCTPRSYSGYMPRSSYMMSPQAIPKACRSPSAAAESRTSGTDRAWKRSISQASWVWTSGSRKSVWALSPPGIGSNSKRVSISPRALGRMGA